MTDFDLHQTFDDLGIQSEDIVMIHGDAGVAAQYSQVPPDKRLDQHLILLDTRTESSVEVKAFFSPRRFNGPVRCDLHPRWDRTGKYICIDCAYNGKREMVLLKLSSLRIN